MKKTVFITALVSVVIGCSFAFNKTASTNLNHSSSSLRDTIFQDDSSKRIVYKYDLIDNQKILRSMIKSEKMTVLDYKGEEFKRTQEVYFNENGEFIRLINTKSIRSNEKGSVIMYHRDKFSLDENGRDFKEVMISDSNNIIVDLYKFKGKILDMTRNGDYGVPVYDCSLRAPVPIKIDSIGQ